MKSSYIILWGIAVSLVLIAGCTEDRTVEANTAMPPTYMRCQGESCGNVVAPNGVFTDLNQILDCDYKEVITVRPPFEREGSIMSWVSCDGQTYHYEQLISKTGKRFWLKVEGVRV